jgi:hypothetical protein
VHAPAASRPTSEGSGPARRRRIGERRPRQVEDSPPSGSRNRRSDIRSRADPNEEGESPDQLATSFIEAGPKPARYRRINSSTPCSSVAAGGPTQSSASPYRSAARRSLVARRNHVDRHPQQRALDHGTSFERARERGAFERAHPRPQADVGGGRVLGLQPADPLDRLRDRQRGAFQQQLPRQQRAVQLTLGQRPLGDPGSLGPRRRAARSRFDPRSTRDRRTR